MPKTFSRTTESLMADFFHLLTCSSMKWPNTFLMISSCRWENASMS